MPGHEGTERSPEQAARTRDLFPYEAQAPGQTVGGRLAYHVRGARLRFLAQRGRGALLEADQTVREVLRHPKIIFSGIRKDEDEAPDGDGWLCYCGRPKFRFEHATGRCYAAAQDRAFLVFVTKEGILYNWRWEEADLVTCKPTNCEGRFRNKVFP